MALTRQNIPVLDRKKYALADLALKGGYVLADCESEPEIILIGTGSEVQLCIAAYEQLIAKGIKARVVSMPCVELFEKQNQSYKEEVLPKTATKRLAIEAGTPEFWYKYVGLEGKVIGVEKFGASAPAKIVLREYGFSVENVLKEVLGMI